MARVYRVEGDVNHFQSLDVDLEPVGWASSRQWTFNGKSKADTWTPPKVHSLHVGLEVPDIWTFRGALVFPPVVADQLHHEIIGAGELLPLPYKGETWQVLNILAIDCLDEDATEWDLASDGSRSQAKNLAFVERRLPDNLFKVPQSFKNLGVERVGTDVFKLEVERLGLSGLEFTYIWDSESPIHVGLQPTYRARALAERFPNLKLNRPGIQGNSSTNGT